MSYYKNYDFISPEPLFAVVEEELRSYFNSGMVDNTLFGTWTNECLEKLGKSSYEVLPAILNIQDFTADLPDNFVGAREVWACTIIEGDYQLPSAVYSQVTSIRLDDPDLRCNVCSECEFPDIIQAIYKTTNTVAYQFRREYLLTPGNIYPSVPDMLYSINKNAVSQNSYDIRNNKISVTFREGVVYLQYYSSDFNPENQMIPDTYRTKEYIKAYLRQKIFEQIFNQTTDETYNQSFQKYQLYTQKADEAFINVVTDNKKEDVYRKQRATKRLLNRFRKFDIR